LSYYSIELDEELLLWSLKTTLPFLKLERILTLSGSNQLLTYQGEWQDLSSETNTIIAIQIYVGDGRVTLPMAASLNKISSLNAIFQDAFSPRKNPALWSVEWFLFLKSISAPNVQLSTYSSAVSIRKSLLAANWTVESAAGFAFKKSMTKAKLSGVTNEQLLLQMTRSPSLEIHDK
ncbi:MAG: MnmC family methyltransferase, partial [Bacteriovorax sp.]|nr:MnmC family methyltransferase [Bacteriovorax sp.]